MCVGSRFIVMMGVFLITALGTAVSPPPDAILRPSKVVFKPAKTTRLPNPDDLRTIDIVLKLVTELQASREVESIIRKLIQKKNLWVTNEAPRGKEVLFLVMPITPPYMLFHSAALLQCDDPVYKSPLSPTASRNLIELREKVWANTIATRIRIGAAMVHEALHVVQGYWKNWHARFKYLGFFSIGPRELEEEAYDEERRFLALARSHFHSDARIRAEIDIQIEHHYAIRHLALTGQELRPDR